MKGTVLGIEGTAGTSSAAIVNENDVIAEVTTYRMCHLSGGIPHPREAATHAPSPDYASHLSREAQLRDEGPQKKFSISMIDGNRSFSEVRDNVALPCARWPPLHVPFPLVWNNTL
jgi:tRNA A37 threonylcarbamoyltransferase TsaD